MASNNTDPNDLGADDNGLQSNVQFTFPETGCAGADDNVKQSWSDHKKKNATETAVESFQGGLLLNDRIKNEEKIAYTERVEANFNSPGSCRYENEWPSAKSVDSVKFFMWFLVRFVELSTVIGVATLLPAVGVDGSLIVSPVNTLGVIGQKVVIRCSTDSVKDPVVYWYRTFTNSDMPELLYTGKHGFNGNLADGRLTMEKNATSGAYNLVISSVLPKDAGTYKCVDESGLGTQSSAELIVSDKLKCVSNIPADGVMGSNVFAIEQDLMTFSCNLTYTGKAAPSLDWSWPGSEKQKLLPTMITSPSFVSTTLKLFPKKEYHNATFSCHAHASGQPVQDDKTWDGLHWLSDPVLVKYAEFETIEMETCPGIKKNLICNPDCSCSLSRTEESCKCVYTYEIKNHRYVVTSEEVACNETDHIILIWYFMLLGILAGTVVTVVIIVIIYLVLTKKKRYMLVKRNEESGKSRL